MIRFLVCLVLIASILIGLFLLLERFQSITITITPKAPHAAR